MIDKDFKKLIDRIKDNKKWIPKQYIREMKAALYLITLDKFRMIRKGDWIILQEKKGYHLPLDWNTEYWENYMGFDTNNYYTKYGIL